MSSRDLSTETDLTDIFGRPGTVDGSDLDRGNIKVSQASALLPPNRQAW
jgi:hypothetical protein